MDGNDETRSRYGVICGVIGIALNCALFAGKFFAGILSGAIAITADAFNNLSDAGASLVALLGFKLAAAKPDAEHPYGHGRMEYVSAFIVSAIIIVMGFELLRSSVTKIIDPEEIEFSPLIVVILIISILIKVIMFSYNYLIGKKINSSVLKATATDSISDVAATMVVLIATIVSHLSGLKLDGYGGVIVSLMIFWAGIQAGRDALNPLLGEKPDKAFIDEIERIALDFDDNISGVHDIMVHDYGPGRRIISLHAEVPADGNILMLHDIIDNLERKLRTDLNCMATIHLDPVVVNDPAVNEIKKEVKEAVGSIHKGVSIHDFRMVTGETHTNLIFDVVVPFSCQMTNSEIKAEVDRRVKEKLGREYFTVIDIDKDSYEE